MENTKHTPGPWKIQPHTTVDKEFTVGPAIGPQVVAVALHGLQPAVMGWPTPS